jgi:hypothetical protein
MNARRSLVALATLALLGSPPMPGEPDLPEPHGPKVKLTRGVLARNTSCPPASYALVGFCAYFNGVRTPQLFVDVAGRRSADFLLGHYVQVRGVVESTDCAVPTLRVTHVGLSVEPPPFCPEICRPDDPPPCPPQ